MLVELSLETYANFMVSKGNNKVLYVLMIKALYGMFQSLLLYTTRNFEEILS